MEVAYQMKFILTAPSLEDLIHLLKAWRFWMLGAILGAILGAATRSRRACT